MENEEEEESSLLVWGSSGDAVGRGTEPQDERFRPQLPVESVEIFKGPNHIL
jgi:hypothetical protein